MNRDIIAMLVLVVIIAGSVCIIKCIYHCVVKTNFSKTYRIGKLPKSIKIKKKKNGEGKNYYKLSYPHWAVEKKDGTADGRIKNNRIIWEKSNLYVDNYMIFSKRPYDLVKTVKRLRLQGVEIELCGEERKKYTNLLKKKDAFTYDAGIQKLIDFYSEKPTGFEGLCSDLFRSMGYATRLTPPTNDGGYDILLNGGGESVVVECKCYSIGHKVGRPSVQKLVGANNIVLADRMIFITTSDFSSSAVSYAREVGVELINGYTLMDLLNEQGFMEKERVEVSMMECQLNVSDLYSYVPNDIYKRFFIQER